MNESLQEFCDWRGASPRVDRAAGAIRGVKILGLASRNGRRYAESGLAAAVPLYENAKVNVNHPHGQPGAPRDYQDRIGAVRDVQLRPGEGLFADFHYNPHHPLVEQLLWDAEHAPENVGFSHHVEARTQRGSGAVVVEEILRVLSVDLVADPATTHGLFENRADPPPETASGKPAATEPPARRLAEATLDELRQTRPDLVDQIAGPSQAELAQLREAVARHEACQRQQSRDAEIRRLLAEFQLPVPDDASPAGRAILDPPFLESLATAADAAALRSLVAARARLVETVRSQLTDAVPSRPTARDQHSVYQSPSSADAKSFAAALCKLNTEQ